MATGNTLVQFMASDMEYPTAGFPALNTRNTHRILQFDATTVESGFFSSVLPRHYGGGGVTAYVHYAMTSATANRVVWGLAFERIGDGQQDLDTDGFAAEQIASGTVPGTAGHVDILPAVFTDGAQVDSIAVGEMFRIYIKRMANHSHDDSTGDAELIGLELKET